jgi:hypothetical protein
MTNSESLRERVKPEKRNSKGSATVSVAVSGVPRETRLPVGEFRQVPLSSGKLHQVPPK